MAFGEFLPSNGFVDPGVSNGLLQDLIGSPGSKEDTQQEVVSLQWSFALEGVVHGKERKRLNST